MLTYKIHFNQTEYHSIQEIKLSTIWEHVTNDNSKAVETIPAKNGRINQLTFTTGELGFFPLPNDTEMKIFQRSKYKALNNPNDFRLQSIDLQYYFLIARLPFLVGNISI